MEIKRPIQALVLGAAVAGAFAHNLEVQAQAKPPAKQTLAAKKKAAADALAADKAKKEAADKAAKTPPPFVAPADPSTPAGEVVMLASDAYKKEFAEAKASYDASKPLTEHQLKTYDEKTVAAPWLKYAAEAFRGYAKQLRALNEESKPSLGEAKSQSAVDTAYGRSGKLSQVGGQAARDISAVINNLYHDEKFKEFFTQAIEKLEKKHQDATALKVLAAQGVFVDMDTPAYNSAAALSPRAIAIQNENAAVQLELIAKYLDSLPTTPGAMPGTFDKGFGKFLKQEANKEGAKWNGPLVTVEFAKKINDATGLIHASLARFEKYVKQNDLVISKPTPETSYVVSPLEFGKRGGVSGFVAGYSAG